MKKYFIYELKKNGLLMASLCVIMTVIYLSSLQYYQSDWFGAYSLRLWEISLLGGIAAAAVPIILFEYKMKKRDLDLYYGLPLSHRRVFVVKYLVGLICLYAPYTFAYFIGMIVNIALHGSVLNAVYYVPHYLSTLIPLYIIYSISAFLFTRANTFIDGIFTVAAAAFAPAMVIVTLDSLVGVYMFDYYYWLPFAPLDTATSYFQDLIVNHPSATSADNIAALVNMWISYPLWAVASGVSTYLMIRWERNAKAEDAEQISTSWFSYKTMLPLYSFCLTVAIIQLGFNGSVFIIYIVMLVGMYLLSVLYKRNLKIGWVTALSIVLAVVAGIAFDLCFYFITHI